MLKFFTTGSPSVAKRRSMKCGPRYSCVPAETLICSFIEALNFCTSFFALPIAFNRRYKALASLYSYGRVSR